jgi:NDP-sugar pyrophosphorylase family protein
VEPGASVAGGTVTGAGSVIETGAQVMRSVLFDGTRAGARVWPEVTLGPTSVRFSTDG